MENHRRSPFVRATRSLPLHYWDHGTSDGGRRW